MNDEEIKAKLKADLEAELEEPMKWWAVLLCEQECPKIAVMPARGKYTAFYELQKAGEKLDMFDCISTFLIPKELVFLIPQQVVGKAVYMWDFVEAISGEHKEYEMDEEDEDEEDE